MDTRICLMILGLGIVLVSCQKQDCHRSQRNPILSSYNYNTKAYQEELYRLIKESPDVDYYFEERQEIFGQIYLVVSAYGDAFCGKLALVISEEEARKIPLDKTKGYQGAQLIGLSYTRRASNYGWSTLVYDSLEYIVD